ncbi:hypothetical protein CPPEL_01820 [Corynebacterium pseudopelargi]|uniref:Core-binding (CB) domain-containing protein n=1 Tax=Corynebacterium pseudopelargi TaxID=2080757 RepID=A0A3G6IWN4_9CORY|nr:hypothetical protein CPPEL_01820 [Corynebacterium pseudopelargi]
MSRGRPATPLGTIGKINITKKPNGKDQAEARYRTTTGKTLRVRAQGTSKTAAERNLKTKCRDKDATTNTTQGLNNTTELHTLITYWLERHDVTNTTKNTYNKAIRLHIKPHLRQHPTQRTHHTPDPNIPRHPHPRNRQNKPRRTLRRTRPSHQMGAHHLQPHHQHHPPQTRKTRSRSTHRRTNTRI